MKYYFFLLFFTIEGQCQYKIEYEYKMNNKFSGLSLDCFLYVNGNISYFTKDNIINGVEKVNYGNVDSELTDLINKGYV